MTLFDHYLSYMEKLCEGHLSAPAGITLQEPSPEKRALELQQQIADMGIPAFVRACAEVEGTVIDESVYADFSSDDLLASLQAMAASHDAPAEESPAEDDPDKEKHAFEVFLDCINQEDSLVTYLIEVIKNEDWKEFFKLSQITTKMDLDPQEFLYWLGNKEFYAGEEEQKCVLLMDRCLARLMEEKKLELAAALLSGDQTTFEIFRCEAPELCNVPEATFEWFCQNYLDRDYPLRMLMRFHGVKFPEKLNR